MSIWDNEGQLARLEKERATKRVQGERLPFDCMNLICRGDRVYCKLGIHLGRAYDGTMPLITVLRGMVTSVCSRCEVYTEDEPFPPSLIRTYQG